MWKPDPSDIRSFEQDRMDANRTQRNALLAASDWTQAPDARCDQARWAIYRNMVRDVDLSNPVWPEPPESGATAEDLVRIEKHLDRAARTVLFDGKNKP
jgi:hypothetical protein